MSCDILFTSVPYTVTKIAPAAPAILIGMLEYHGYTGKFYDFNVLTLEDPDVKNFALGKNPSNTEYLDKVYRYHVNKMLEYKPNYIGISLFTYQCIRTAQLLCIYIRTIAPEVKIILGGPGLSHNGLHGVNIGAEWQELQLCDYWVKSEGENPIIEILKGDYISTPKWKQITDLDEFPIPVYDSYNWSLYKKHIPITGSRGCVRQCTFCDIHTHWKKFVWRSGKSIADEMIAQSIAANQEGNVSVDMSNYVKHDELDLSGYAASSDVSDLDNRVATLEGFSHLDSAAVQSIVTDAISGLATKSELISNEDVASAIADQLALQTFGISAEAAKTLVDESLTAHYTSTYIDDTFSKKEEIEDLQERLALIEEFYKGEIDVEAELEAFGTTVGKLRDAVDTLGTNLTSLKNKVGELKQPHAQTAIFQTDEDGNVNLCYVRDDGNTYCYTVGSETQQESASSGTKGITGFEASATESAGGAFTPDISGADIDITDLDF